MKVLTKNVKLKFKCWNVAPDECPFLEAVEIDVDTLGEKGIPKCPKCGTTMDIEAECLVTN